MKTAKEREYLIFALDDGSVVKYNLATHETIGKSGKPVRDLKTQLRGYSISQVVDSFENDNYRIFLNFVMRRNPNISNVGTLLERAGQLSRFEQIFSSGIKNVSADFRYTINDIPKWLIKFCRDTGITLEQKLYNTYSEMPDALQIACEIDFTSISIRNIVDVFVYNGTLWGDQRSNFIKLCQDFGYTAKPLWNYLDYLMTYEAIEDVRYIIRELYDYANMMHEISPKFDKYPRNFLTTHKIAVRNYNRLKVVFEEKKFTCRRDPSLECKIGDYVFIYPKSTQDIKDEAVQQNNCVASYIKRVIDGECHILFMRLAAAPDKSLVTIEMRDNKIVQALQRFNTPLTDEQRKVVEIWNKKHQKEKEMATAC